MSLNILIVDDSETVRAVIAKTLELSGVPVNDLHHAGHGQAALDLMKDQWIDLVFSDINMPVMNGIEMIKQMKADDVLKAVPVVVISTEGSKTRIEQLSALGVYAYIRKPFTPEQIRAVVDEVIGEIGDGEQP